VRCRVKTGCVSSCIQAAREYASSPKPDASTGDTTGTGQARLALENNEGVTQMKKEVLTTIEDEMLDGVAGGGIGRAIGGAIDKVLGLAGNVVGGALSALGGVLSGLGRALGGRGH